MLSTFILTGASFDGWRLRFLRPGMILLMVLVWCGRSEAYSILTHEEIVDLLWTDEIRPLLVKRYPALTEDQIREAHAYAYGGAVNRDLDTGNLTKAAEYSSRTASTRNFCRTGPNKERWIALCALHARKKADCMM